MNRKCIERLTDSVEEWNVPEYSLQVPDNKGNDRFIIKEMMFANWGPVIVYIVLFAKKRGGSAMVIAVNYILTNSYNEFKDHRGWK